MLFYIKNHQFLYIAFILEHSWLKKVFKGEKDVYKRFNAHDMYIICPLEKLDNHSGISRFNPNYKKIQTDQF